jgi:cell division topological specificity factor
MFGWFAKRRSKDSLKERLKLVLSYDRAKLTPGKMEELKGELLGVIAKYFPSEAADYDVRFEQQGDRMVLMANLPLKDAKKAQKTPRK